MVENQSAIPVTLSVSLRTAAFAAIVALGFVDSTSAQQPPAMAYMFPPGGQAGQTIDVTLGGYDWTPDMQIFVHDSRIKLEILAPPGPVIVPEPPYWFGKKARRAPFLLPREIPARLTIPSDISPGIVRWQAANANGATATGRFVVGNGVELIEFEDRKTAQALSALPVTVSGRIKHIEEVDRYQFTVKKSGPVTCAVVARGVGSILNAVVEVRNNAGRLIADTADTAGNDTAVTFAAEAGRRYTLSVYDVDFRGNRAFVYRLSITPGPRVVAAIPAAGKRGETRPVLFVGYGVATGAAQLESTTRTITFPADKQATSLSYRLETAHGTAPPFSLLVSDLPEMVESPDASNKPPKLSVPAAVSGVLGEHFGKDRYHLSGKTGDMWSLQLMAAQIGSPLDVVLSIRNANGKELARSDDLPGSTDAALQFTVPADGDFEIAVSDVSGDSGNLAAVYRLTVEAGTPGFNLTAAEWLNAPIAGKSKLALKATRNFGFKGPIAISFEGFPKGVTVPEKLAIPAGKTALNIELSVAADAAATASLVTVTGEATVEEKTVRQTTGRLLVATTIKPPFTIDAEGKDDVTKWPRGTTFPAPVLIHRDEGFQGEIVLEMSSRQGRHRQGITGPELKVPPDVKRILYPIFLPEWLETTRTSRMTVNGVAKVADPKGNIRYLVSRQKTRMGFLPGGALLKISADVTELQIEPGGLLTIPLTISRSQKLDEPIRLELLASDQETKMFTANPQTLTADQNRVRFPITVAANAAVASDYELTIRATLLQNGNLPVVSETKVLVQLGK